MAINKWLKSFFKSDNEKRIKAYQPIIEAINALESHYEGFSDDELKAETSRFRAQLDNGEATLDDLIEPAFALVREASKRALGLRHFDVQLVGGLVLHEGSVAEMKTGEGKTLVATLPVYLNALEGKGVTVVTVNDYLAQRDSEWMGKVYNQLGLTVGVVINGIDDEARHAAYAADVTYATNNELGFDYLRDNMKYDKAAMVQRDHHFAIVDEVDSILIDEARTPLIISGAVEDRANLYQAINELAKEFEASHFEIDEKSKTATLTDEGNEFAEVRLREMGFEVRGNLYDSENVSYVHHLNQALKAHQLFQRDRDYIVKGDQVILIDEFTGRMMAGRRYSGGLHQALEAKEGVPLQAENQTMASVTFQNYFRLYSKLSGMTGTAMTEAEELSEIYGLDVVEIPTNKPVSRKDDDDQIYRTQAEKFTAIIKTIRECHERGQPILVGTVSIEKSEALSEALKKENITHQVLNARHHEQEAKIIALAGVPGAITIATNMAGRGTDIQLGGNADLIIAEEIASLEDDTKAAKIEEIKSDIAAAKTKALAEGGLFVLGTERHESRRIDNQLRGRSGRQGDPGTSRFYLALDDDLMRVFGSERMDKMLGTLGIEENEAIVHPWINKAIERAQKKVEARNYDIRKNVLKYDNVLNDQRKVIFEQRRELMAEETVEETIDDMRSSACQRLIDRFAPAGVYPDQWQLDELDEEVNRLLLTRLPIKAWGAEEGVGSEDLFHKLRMEANKLSAKKRLELGAELTPRIEKAILLQTIDHLWREHIERLEHLRQVIGYRGIAQRDPLQEYKSESFELFSTLLAELREAVTSNMMRVQLANDQESEAEEIEPKPQNKTPQPAADLANKTPRNAPCPCGSGKKFKHCHGKLA